MQDTLLIGADATSTAVAEAVVAAVKKCRRDSLLVFYFAGSAVVSRSGELQLISSNFGAPSDGSGLSATQINEILAGAPAAVRIVILDTSYSGSAITGTM